ncbi:SIR2 family protein, partial [Mycolicibacterium mageritense]|uniref:SIR2 family protein n=1 Tax=Mycolicibacterium mageritense TaxID=53462 RepID=UPI001E459B7A
RASLALSDDDFPLLVKLHGDFREHALKNLESELQSQDAKLRQAFLDSSRRFGLAVIGYSGRDASVMTMLNDAVATSDALPGGLWWLTRDPSSALPAVAELMERADKAGVTARFVTIENFDETFASLGRTATLKPALRSHVDQLRTTARVVDAALPAIEAGDFP